MAETASVWCTRISDVPSATLVSSCRWDSENQFRALFFESCNRAGFQYRRSHWSPDTEGLLATQKGDSRHGHARLRRARVPHGPLDFKPRGRTHAGPIYGFHRRARTVGPIYAGDGRRPGRAVALLTRAFGAGFSRSRILVVRRSGDRANQGDCIAWICCSSKSRARRRAANSNACG